MRTFFKRYAMGIVRLSINVFTCMAKSVVIQATGRFPSSVSILSDPALSKARDLTVLTFDGVIQPEETD